ncbi:hypothetical protein MASR1M60_11340 [Rhodocyclaceae bacterium]
MKDIAHYATAVSDFAKLHEAIGADYLNTELRKIEQERSRWMNAMIDERGLADQIDKLMGANSAAAQYAQQMFDAQKAQEESIRKMLDPLENIRSSLLNDSSIQRMMDELTQPAFASDHFTKLIDQVSGPASQLGTLYPHAEDSLEQARRMLAEASLGDSLQQMMKSFGDANKRWVVPATLIDAIAPLQAWQDQLGKLSLPVMDIASAATLASLLGREGIEAQLAALGINPDGSLNVQFEQKKNEGDISNRHWFFNPSNLLNIILALLLFAYQEHSSSRWQAATDERLAKQSEALEIQRNMIKSLAKLVEKALVHEAKQQEQRFVVMERVTLVRSGPESGASVLAKLLPQEVVRPISEEGKWIQFEYYHWFHREYRTGWALKKYFQRVARPSNNQEKAEQ